MSESAAMAAGQALATAENAQAMAEENKQTAEGAQARAEDAERVAWATVDDLAELRARIDACELEGRVSRAHVKALIAHFDEMETEPIAEEVTGTVIEDAPADAGSKKKDEAPKDETLRDVRGWW